MNTIHFYNIGKHIILIEYSLTHSQLPDPFHTQFFVLHLCSQTARLLFLLPLTHSAQGIEPCKAWDPYIFGLSDDMQLNTVIGYDKSRDSFRPITMRSLRTQMKI